MEVTQLSFPCSYDSSKSIKHLPFAIATDSLDCPVKSSSHLAWPHFEVDVVSAAKSACWENVEKYVAYDAPPPTPCLTRRIVSRMGLSRRNRQIARRRRRRRCKHPTAYPAPVKG